MNTSTHMRGYAAVAGSVLAGLILGGCMAQPRDEAAREVEAIAEVLSQRPLARMDDVWAPVPTPAGASEGAATFAPVPQVTDVVSDGPRYFVYQPPGAGAFWIRRTSGLTGAACWYGPFTLGDDGKIRGGP